MTRLKRIATVLCLACTLASTSMLAAPAVASAAEHFSGARALEDTRQLVALGPRWPGSEGHRRVEAFLKKQFAHDALEDDGFTGNTPAGLLPMHNFIVRFPGKKDGVIVLATHYETNYSLRDTGYVGANDGGSTTGLLLEIANHLRGRRLDGYSVWLVFFDGEESVSGNWTSSDSTYGSRHLAAKWQNDGTLKRIKAFLLGDMIGDRDLDIQRDGNSTDWLLDLVYRAASRFGYQSHFFVDKTADEDDHLPFVRRGVPCADLIDLNYGPQNAYWHTPQDTMDKISARSLTISGDTLLESIRLLNLR